VSHVSTQSDEPLNQVDATAEWEKANVGDLQWHVEKSLKNKKYLLIWDQVGTCPVYFDSMEILNETGLLKEKVKSKELRHMEMLSILRQDSLKAMSGDRSSCVVFNLAD
jgi:hypothetical protein